MESDIEIKTKKQLTKLHKKQISQLLLHKTSAFISNYKPFLSQQI